MYLVAWSDEAFEQMSRIVSENPARKDNWLRHFRNLRYDLDSMRIRQGSPEAEFIVLC